METETTKKFNKLKVYAIIITVILLLVGGYFGYNYFGTRIATTYYTEGYSQATIDIISNIQQTGSIPVFDNSTGQVEIKSLSLQEICQGGNG